MVTVMQMSTAGDASSSQTRFTPAAALRPARSMNTGLGNGVQAEGGPADVTAVVEPVAVEALYPYAGDDQNHLHFAKGDLIEVWGRESSGWWDGILIKSRSHERGARGWFPSSESQASFIACLSTMLGGRQPSPNADILATTVL
jgi:hypothetical protein